MGFFSGIVHAIGQGIGDVEDFFGGGNKKKAQQNDPYSSQQTNASQQQGSNQLQVQQSQPSGQFNGPSISQPTPYQPSVTLANQPLQGSNPDPSSLVKANQQSLNQTPAANQTITIPNDPNPISASQTTTQTTSVAPAQHKSLLSSIGDTLVSPFRPLGEGIARLLPGGQNDIKANDDAIAQNDQNLQTFTALHKAGKMSDNAYRNALLQSSQDSAAAGQEATRIGNTASRSRVVGSALATASAPFLGAANIGETLLAKVASGVGVGALEGANNELTTNADPTLKGAAQQAAFGAVGGGALPVLGSIGGRLIKATRGGGVASSALENAVNTEAPAAAGGLESNEVSAGVKSVNPAGQQDAAAHIAQNAPTETPQPNVQPPVTGPNGEEVAQISHEAPNAQAPQLPANQVNRASLQNEANDLTVPAYQRVAAKNQLAELDAADQAAQAKALGVGDDPAIDSPAYQRRGQQLPSEAPPTPQAINDGLNENAGRITKAPENADMVNRAFRETGGSNPLSLVAHELSGNTNKNEVRNIVQQLIPEAKGNTLNRAVNTITGSDNQVDVLQALHEASSGAKTPVGELGPVSTAEAKAPTAVAGNPNATPLVDQETAARANAAQAESDRLQRQANTKNIGDAPQIPDAISNDAARTGQAPALPEQSQSAPVGIPQALEKPPVASAELTPTQSSPASSEQPALSETPVEKTSSPPNVAQSEAQVNPSGRTAENAAKVRPALEKQLGDASKGLEGSNDVHEVLSNPELSAAGKAVTDTMSDQEIVNRYSRPVKFVEPSDIAAGNASLDRLSTVARNSTGAEKEAAQASINNIIDAAAEVQSRSGRVLNYGQEMLNNLSPEQRTAYYIRHIDEINTAKLGDSYTKLADDPARAAKVEATLNEIFTKDEAIRSQIAEKQSILTKATDEATRGDVSVQELKNAAADVQTLQRQQRLNAGDMTREYSDLLPGRGKADAVGNWQRTAMLSSPTGRGRAIAGTGLNVVDEGIKQGVSGVLGKVTNLLSKDQNAVNDTGMNLTAVAKGAYQGLKKTVNSARGNFEIENPEKAINGDPAASLSAMNKFTGGPIKRAVSAVVESHSNMTEGVAQSELIRSARTEGVQKGLSGEDLQKYTIARAAQPSAEMKAGADEVHRTLNNLNDNPISNSLRAVGQAAEKNLGPVGKVIKNQIMPFPTFLGGNIWNAVTDKNVVAATVKIGAAALRGDKQGVIDNIAKAGVEGGKTYALGWQLSQQGILTNKDANGKDYDGVYMHIGSHYIPVRDVGFFAPSMILGNAAYQGFNDPKNKGNVAGAIGETATKTLGSAYRVLSGQSIVNPTSQINTPVGQSFPGSGADAPGQLAKVAGNVLGQNIPAATGDVNALLNGSHLDPTHEAANTKVTTINPATGKSKTDPIETAKDVLLNKIPIASQQLPRKAGIPASDLLDRFLSDTKETPTQVQAKAVKQSAADKIAANEKAGIPDISTKYSNGDNFKEAVENRIENKKYDQAIAGLNTSLAKESNGPNPTSQKLDPIKKQIAEVTVLKNGNWEPNIRDEYKKTSDSMWRNYGDPKNAGYDPERYQQLYNYDSQLAAAGASANSLDPTDNKFSAKTAKGGRGSGGGSGNSVADILAARAAKNEAMQIKDNTVTSTPQQKAVSFGSLAPQKAITAVPILQKILPSDLVKKRTISVATVHA